MMLLATMVRQLRGEWPQIWLLRRSSQTVVFT